MRTFLTAGSYNSKQLYSDETIAEAEERWDQLERAYEAAVEVLDSPAASSKVDDESLRDEVDGARESFATAMNDDFNTREAQSALLSVATAINRHLEDANDESDRKTGRLRLPRTPAGRRDSRNLGASSDSPLRAIRRRCCTRRRRGRPRSQRARARARGRQLRARRRTARRTRGPRRRGPGHRRGGQRTGCRRASEGRRFSGDDRSMADSLRAAVLLYR